MDEVEIPHYIDAQPQVFFWELDEFAPVVFFIAVGVATDTLSAWFPFMIAFTYAFKRFKGAQMEGVLVHLGYWWGIMPLNKVFENGTTREYVS